MIGASIGNIVIDNIIKPVLVPIAPIVIVVTCKIVKHLI